MVKPWYGYLLESVHKRDPYPDSKLAQLLLAFEINRLAKVIEVEGGEEVGGGGWERGEGGRG